MKSTWTQGFGRRPCATCGNTRPGSFTSRANFEHWFELKPGLNRDAERHDGRNLTVRQWTLPLFYLVTVAGLFALVRARRAAAAQLLALAAAYFTVVCLLSISVPRLRSIFDGCVALAAGLALAWVIDRNARVDDRPPRARPLRAVRSAVILGLIAVVVATTALAWRAETHRQARRAVETAVARDVSAIDALVAEYKTGRSAGEPPRLVQKDLDLIQNLTTVLGNRTPQVAVGMRPSVGDALRAVRVVSHEANVISLLSAAEYIDASAKHRPPSRDTVRTRYEREVRSDDPTLEPWREVISGRSLLHARSTLEQLHRLAA